MDLWCLTTYDSVKAAFDITGIKYKKKNTKTVHCIVGSAVIVNQN